MVPLLGKTLEVEDSPGMVWSVCRGYLGGAGRGDLRYSEQAEQVGNLEMNLCNRRQEYLIDFFNKYCLFSKDLIHTQSI